MDDMISSTPVNKVEGDIFTPVQLGILDFHWDQHAFKGRARPPSGRSKHIAQELSENGPAVTAQSVGRYYGARLAEVKGHAPKTVKTPEQLQLLNESWERDPYPTVGQTILLVHDTGLTKAQVQTWFSQKREKVTRAGGALNSSNGPGQPCQEAVLFWERYEFKPERTVTGLRNGRIDHKTGAQKAFVDYVEFKKFFKDAFYPECAGEELDAWLGYYKDLNREEFLEWLDME